MSKCNCKDDCFKIGDKVVVKSGVFVMGKDLGGLQGVVVSTTNHIKVLFATIAARYKFKRYELTKAQPPGCETCDCAQDKSTVEYFTFGADYFDNFSC